MRVQAAPPEHFPWFTQRTGYPITQDFRAIEAVDDAGEPLGMIGFDHWCPNSAQVHVALDTPAAVLPLLHKAFAYPFIQAGRGVLIAMVAEMNRKSLKLAKALGFKPVHRVADGWSPGVDVWILEMRRENCRWLRPQQRATA